MRFNTQDNGGKVRHNDTPIYRGFVVCRAIYAAFAPMSHVVARCRMSYIEKSQWKQTFSKPEFPYSLA